jgi:uncharacterized membrane protein YhaH (DUF805 family)
MVGAAAARLDSPGATFTARGNTMGFTQHLRAWFGWRGRLRRRTYLAQALVATAVFVLLFVFLQGTVGRGPTLLLYPPFFACLLGLTARRLHDMARGAGWLAVVLVPVLGPLFLAFLLVFKRGTDGENQFGRDPRLVGRDYLTVSAYEPA